MTKTDMIDRVTQGHITAIDRALRGSDTRTQQLENILMNVRHHLVLLDSERKSLLEICDKWEETCTRLEGLAKSGESK